MKHFARTLTLLMAFLMVVALPFITAGCDSSSAPSVTDTVADTADTLEEVTTKGAETVTTADTDGATELPTEEVSEPSAAEVQEDLQIILDKASSYRIVYPEGASAYALNTVNTLRDTLVRNYRLDKNSLGLMADGSPQTEGDDKSPEILVGLTNRAESRSVAATLPENAFTVTSVGSKLILLGSDDYHTALAVNYFLEHCTERYQSDLVFSHASTVTEVSDMQSNLPAEGGIRIMSWNLHCPSKEEQDLFAHMLDGILYYGADIIGLQECNAAAHQGVVDKLKDTFAVATTYHSGTSTYDYTPILYNPKRFALLDSGVEWLDGRYTGTNTKCLSWAVFADRDNSGKKLIVINFHGAVASNDYKGMESMTKEELTAQATAWKVDNVHQIHRRIAALEEKYGDGVPVFVTGDYNTSFGAEPYTLMESYGYLDAEFNAVISAVTGTKSTHTIGQKPVAGKSIDHVFFSPDRGITAFVHTFGMRQTDLDATDHLPLIVDFAIDR